MRKIEFRGKLMIDCGDYKKGEWVYGYPVSDGNEWYIINGIVESTEDYFQPEKWFLVDPETVGQYTGVMSTDDETCEPTKLFEGDIVCVCNAYEPSFNAKVVFYNEENFCNAFYLKHYDPELRRNSFDLIDHDEGRYTILGNMFDNPELLEKDRITDRGEYAPEQDGGEEKDGEEKNEKD